MDSLLDVLFNGLKRLEGRVVPRGWSADVVLGFVVATAVLVTVLAFVMFER